MPTAEDEIFKSNIELHRIEAKNYRQIHSEIYNFYEQQKIKKHLDLICHHCSNRDSRAALDIGTGVGNLLFKFLERGFAVTGVDLSKEMLDELEKLYGKNNKKGGIVTLVNQDADSFIEKELKGAKNIPLSLLVRFFTIYLIT